MKSRHTGRPIIRTGDNQYKKRCYTLSIRTLSHFEGAIGKGGRSEFVEEAIQEKLERREAAELQDLCEQVDRLEFTRDLSEWGGVL